MCSNLAVNQELQQNRSPPLNKLVILHIYMYVQIRLPHRLSSYVWTRFKHFLMSYDESETTSCMQFVAILYLSGIRLAIQKKVIS